MNEKVIQLERSSYYCELCMDRHAKKEVNGTNLMGYPYTAYFCDPCFRLTNVFVEQKKIAEVRVSLTESIRNTFCKDCYSPIAVYETDIDEEIRCKSCSEAQIIKEVKEEIKAENIYTPEKYGDEILGADAYSSAYCYPVYDEYGDDLSGNKYILV